MIVILEDQLFASEGVNAVSLISLLGLGFEGRHRIQTDPLYDPEADIAVNRWLAEQSPQLREEVQLTLEAGLEEDASDIPADLTVWVADVPEPRWDVATPIFPLDHAVRFLSRPLVLIVEDRKNDQAFLRAVAPERWKKKLGEYLENGWIEVEHGGGVTVMSRTVKQLTRDRVLRAFVLFDSDAREPGKPSKEAQELSTACRSRRLAHHRLRRRAMENYLPGQALAAWASMSAGRRGRERRETVDAFMSMTPPQRHHYNMKGGFRADLKDSRGLSPIYEDVAAEPRLQNGFEDKIGDLFSQNSFPILEEWLLKDGQKDEMLPLVQSIFRRL